MRSSSPSCLLRQALCSLPSCLVSVDCRSQKRTWVLLLVNQLWFGTRAPGCMVVGLCGGAPGDSLLFAAGAFCASGALQLGAVMSTFITAAILGDAVNYTIGHSIGMCAGTSSSPPIWLAYTHMCSAGFCSTEPWDHCSTAGAETGSCILSARCCCHS